MTVAAAAEGLRIGREIFRLHSTLLGAPYPRTLSLESTNFCNLSCSHCGHSQFPAFEKGHFDPALFGKIEHLLGREIRGVSLSNFGEPFMSGVWEYLLRKSISTESLGIFFITNGLLLDRHIDEVVHPRISMAISIDGASEGTYAAFRGGQRFGRLMANLDLLRNEKELHGVSYPHVTFLFTASRTNVDDLPAIVELANRKGASAVIVQLQVFFDRGRFERESLFFAQEEYDRNIRAARQKAADMGVALLHPDSFDGETKVPADVVDNSWLGRDAAGLLRCYAQSTTSYVRYDGVIEACCSPDHNVMGSLRLDSFEDIWHGPSYRDLRLCFDRGEWPGRCGYCNLIQAVDVHDERAHLVELPEGGCSHETKPQPYRITELEKAYRRALSLLDADPGSARDALAPLLRTDANLFEVRNLAACLDGLMGDCRAMAAELEACAAVAPADEIIAHNLELAVSLGKRRGIRRFLPW